MSSLPEFRKEENLFFWYLVLFYQNASLLVGFENISCKIM